MAPCIPSGYRRAIMSRSRSLFSWKFSPQTVTRIGAARWTVSGEVTREQSAKPSAEMASPYCDHDSVSDDRSALDRVRLRAFDLSERTTRLGYRSAQRRLTRWRSRGFLIAQCAVTAGLAWWLAGVLLRHPTPFFAPVAAILVLNVTYGNRLRRGVEVAIGVALGVFVGDVFVHVFGTGVWQIMVVVALAMSLASLLGAGQLMTIQAAVQAVIVTTLLPDPGQGFGRWLDAVVGCVLALVVATVAPSAPLRKPGILAAQLLQEMAATLRAAATALG